MDVDSGNEFGIRVKLPVQLLDEKVYIKIVRI